MAASDSIPEIRDVPGFEGYGVSADGRAWTRRTRVALGANKGTRAVIGETWRELRQAANLRGYRFVGLYQGRRHRNCVIHSLVLTTFVGPKPPGMEARHLDGDQTNNRLENLAWGTHKENEADKGRHGTRIRGEKAHKAVLTETEVRQIRALLREGKKQRDIAKAFGVSQPTVGAISVGRNWKHVR